MASLFTSKAYLRHTLAVSRREWLKRYSALLLLAREFHTGLTPGWLGASSILLGDPPVLVSAGLLDVTVTGHQGGRLLSGVSCYAVLTVHAQVQEPHGGSAFIYLILTQNRVVTGPHEQCWFHH